MTSTPLTVLDLVPISSGSTASGTARLPTTCGAAEPGTVAPPSKAMAWPRL